MLSYISIKQVIRTALIRLGINIERLPLVYPSFPLLLHLISYSLKGCNKWSKLFKKLEHSNSNLQKRERKWEEELQAIQGLNFWGKCYELNTNVFFVNKLKWVQYQITRGTLKTNKIVSTFKADVSINRTYCNLEVETISHLFYECDIKSFIIEVYEYFFNIWVDIRLIPAKKDFIFGFRNIYAYSSNNLLARYIKLFIWRFRCFKNELNLNLLAYGTDKRLSYLADISVNLEIQNPP